MHGLDFRLLRAIPRAEFLREGNFNALAGLHLRSVSRFNSVETRTLLQSVLGPGHKLLDRALDGPALLALDDATLARTCTATEAARVRKLVADARSNESLQQANAAAATALRPPPRALPALPQPVARERSATFSERLHGLMEEHAADPTTLVADEIGLEEALSALQLLAPGEEDEEDGESQSTTLQFDALVIDAALKNLQELTFVSPPAAAADNKPLSASHKRLPSPPPEPLRRSESSPPAVRRDPAPAPRAMLDRSNPDVGKLMMKKKEDPPGSADKSPQRSPRELEERDLLATELFEQAKKVARLEARVVELEALCKAMAAKLDM